MWKLIILFVAAAGGGAGGDVEVVDYHTYDKCVAAAKIINEADTPTTWSGIEAFCVPAD